MSKNAFRVVVGVLRDATNRQRKQAAAEGEQPRW